MATTKKRSPAGKKTAAKPKAATRSKRTKSKSAAPDPSAEVMKITQEERWRMIAVAAYHKAEQRDFQPGGEVDDWLAAEREVDTLLGRSGS